MYNNMRYRSIDDMNHTILGGLPKVPRDIDLVVGIPRSGLLAANMLSLYLNLPMTDLAGLGERRLLSKGKRVIPNYSGDVFENGRRILIVDDCISQGTEIIKTKKKVAEMGFQDRAFYLSVYSFPEKPHLADLVLETIPRPMCFQWSCMHSRELAHYCVDIDGVLCIDPTKDQDDDGQRYEEFLKTAVPLFTPTVEIGWLVTCRLEKYRKQTEEWLAQHNIKYKELIMMDYPDSRARAKANRNAEYKAEVYNETNAMLFIESSAGLAKRISELTNKPVICTNPGELYPSPEYEKFEVKMQKYAWWYRRLLNAPRGIYRRLTGAH